MINGLMIGDWGEASRSRIYGNRADGVKRNLHFLHKDVACLFLDSFQSGRSDDGQEYLF
jgi:hypothetical protein